MSRSKEVIVLAFAIAGCASPAAPPAPAVAPSPPAEWRLVERDGLVVFEPEWKARARPEVRYDGPDRPDVGQVVAIEVRMPDALPGELHRFRVRTLRPSVRLLDAPVVETRGTEAARVRFTSDASGRCGVSVEPAD